MSSRTAAVIIGFVMMAVGLGMTATIVMLPVAIAVLLLGVALVVAGFFGHDDRTELSDR